MLGFPEAQQQHGPRVLAAMSVPRAHASEDEGMRGKKPESLGSAWQTVANVDLASVVATITSQRKQVSSGYIAQFSVCL